MCHWRIHPNGRGGVSLIQITMVTLTPPLQIPTFTAVSYQTNRCDIVSMQIYCYLTIVSGLCPRHTVGRKTILACQSTIFKNKK